MNGPAEGRDPQGVGRFDVPQQSPAPDAEPARRNGHRPVARVAPTPPPTPPADEVDTAATDEPVANAGDPADAGMSGGTEPAVADRPGDHWDSKVAKRSGVPAPAALW